MLANANQSRSSLTQIDEFVGQKFARFRVRLQVVRLQGPEHVAQHAQVLSVVVGVHEHLAEINLEGVRIHVAQHLLHDVLQTARRILHAVMQGLELKVTELCESETVAGLVDSSQCNCPAAFTGLGDAFEKHFSVKDQERSPVENAVIFFEFSSRPSWW